MFVPLWFPVGFLLVSFEKGGCLGCVSFRRRRILGGAYPLVSGPACSALRVLEATGQASVGIRGSLRPPRPVPPKFQSCVHLSPLAGEFTIWALKPLGEDNPHRSAPAAAACRGLSSPSFLGGHMQVYPNCVQAPTVGAAPTERLGGTKCEHSTTTNFWKASGRCGEELPVNFPVA